VAAVTERRTTLRALARPRPPEQPLEPAAASLDHSLDGLSARWRLAFISAQDALAAITRCGASLRFPVQELRERSNRLEHERIETARLLDEVARDERVELRHSLSAPRATKKALGLPDTVLGCVFDLDGVLTASGAVHADAWRVAFDELLARRVERTGERFAPFMPFDPRTDYYRHLHGRPRLDGVHAFLASRGIRLPEGREGDAPGVETIHGLANRKNAALLDLLDRHGVDAFAGSLLYLEGLREAGLPCAVVSPSVNTRAILERSGLDVLVEERVDGLAARAEQLQPKPAPDTMLAACRRLDIPPERAAAFETTLDGVAAARAAHIGFLIAVDRTGRGGGSTLLDQGVDRVVTDLTALMPAPARV
jgi:beta-phosphoglucomutase-like phosphatase (HAD superfamily)